MPISQKFWEWGCPKRGKCQYHCDTALLESEKTLGTRLIFGILNFLLKIADLAVRQHASCAHNSARGEDLVPFTPEILKLPTKKL